MRREQRDYILYYWLSLEAFTVQYIIFYSHISEQRDEKRGEERYATCALHYTVHTEQNRMHCTGTVLRGNPIHNYNYNYITMTITCRLYSVPSRMALGGRVLKGPSQLDGAPSSGVECECLEGPESKWSGAKRIALNLKWKEWRGLQGTNVCHTNAQYIICNYCALNVSSHQHSAAQHTTQSTAQVAHERDATRRDANARSDRNILTSTPLRFCRTITLTLNGERPARSEVCAE